MATGAKILLGHGVVSVNGTPIGLTRGGSAFNLERTFRPIPADGDKGLVQGRIDLDEENAKLTVNALEIFRVAEIRRYFPALSVTPGGGATPTTDIITSTLAIISADYVSVTWTGQTRDGKGVVIALSNAINMANIDWELADRTEVIPVLEFSATYTEAARNTPPWTITYTR